MGILEVAVFAMVGHMVVFGYGSRNTDGSRILEFADGLNLVICNTLLTSRLFQGRNVCQSINC